MKNRKITSMMVFLVLVGTLSLVMAEHPLPTDLIDDGGLMKGMADWAYLVTNGTFWALMLGGFCLVLFIATSVYTTDRAFGYAGFTAIVGSILLTTLDLITWWLASIFILVGVVSVAIMIMARRS